MAELLFVCPKTNQQAPTGIQTDVQSLSLSWKAILKVKCRHCGQVHDISICETYLNGALAAAADQLHLAVRRQAPETTAKLRI
jgi:hypothetical protein